MKLYVIGFNILLLSQRYFFSDFMRKIRILIKRLRMWVYQAFLLKLFERKVICDHAPLVPHLIDQTVCQHPPVKFSIGVVGLGMTADGCGAIVR